MLWAADNVLDKYILTKRLNCAQSYNILTNLNDVFPALIIFLFFPISFSPIFSGIAISLGILMVISLFFYNQAVMKDEVSRVSALEWISPVFVAALALIFLKEKLSYLNYLGIFSVVTGSIIISHEKRHGKIKISPAIGLILIFAFLYAVSDILSDFSLNFMDFWSFFFWTCVGSVSTSIFLAVYPKTSWKLKRAIKNINLKTYFMILTVSVLYYIAELFFYWALSIGSVAIISAIIATQPIFTFTYLLCLNRFAPEILKEQTDQYNFSTKILGIITIVIGVILVTAII